MINEHIKNVATKILNDDSLLAWGDSPMTLRCHPGMPLQFQHFDWYPEPSANQLELEQSSILNWEISNEQPTKFVKAERYIDGRSPEQHKTIPKGTKFEGPGWSAVTIKDSVTQCFLTLCDTCPNSTNQCPGGEINYEGGNQIVELDFQQIEAIQFTTKIRPVFDMIDFITNMKGTTFEHYESFDDAIEVDGRAAEQHQLRQGETSQYSYGAEACEVVVSPQRAIEQVLTEQPTD